MNKGVDLSKGDWLYFLGTDDRFFDKNVLKSLVNLFKDKSIDLIFGRITYKVDTFLPFIYNKNKTEKHPQWNWKIWLYNTVHHQGTFHRKKVFNADKYNTSYNFLSDYEMNINLYKEKISYKIVDTIIASCLSSGVSKTGTWKLYKEEIKLKKKASSIIWQPFFYVIAVSKFFIRKI